MVTTRSSSKKIQSRSRIDKENETPDTNESSILHRESFTKNDSSTEITGKKLTRELVALGIIPNQKKTPKKNLNFEMFSSMKLNTDTMEKNNMDDFLNTLDSNDTEFVTRKEESIENIGKFLSNHCTLGKDRNELKEKPQNSVVFNSRKNFTNGNDNVGYKKPTASWIAKEKTKAETVEESLQKKASMRERRNIYHSKPGYFYEAHYMMPTISNIAKRVSKRSS